jgi:hypothetical protein
MSAPVPRGPVESVDSPAISIASVTVSLREMVSTTRILSLQAIFPDDHRKQFFKGGVTAAIPPAPMPHSCS